MNAAQRRIAQIHGTVKLTESLSTKSRSYITKEARSIAERVPKMQQDDFLITAEFLEGLLSAFAERIQQTVTAEFERGINS